MHPVPQSYVQRGNDSASSLPWTDKACPLCLVSSCAISLGLTPALYQTQNAVSGPPAPPYRRHADQAHVPTQLPAAPSFRHALHWPRLPTMWRRGVACVGSAGSLLMIQIELMQTGP